MANPTCPANCAAPLPVVVFDDCSPETNLSEIEYIIFGKSTTPEIADVDDPSEWATRITNSGVSDDDLRMIRVIGDMPLPEDAEVTISGQRVLTVQRTFTVNAEVDETNDTNHDAFRQMQCGGSYRVWFVTRSGHIFGGTDGIQNATIRANLLLNRGDNEIMRYPVIVTWKSKFMPERSVWPIYGLTTYGGTPITD